MARRLSNNSEISFPKYFCVGAVIPTSVSVEVLVTAKFLEAVAELACLVLATDSIVQQCYSLTKARYFVPTLCFQYSTVD